MNKKYNQDNSLRVMRKRISIYYLSVELEKVQHKMVALLHEPME